HARSETQRRLATACPCHYHRYQLPLGACAACSSLPFITPYSLLPLLHLFTPYSISALTGSSGLPSLPTLPPHLAARCQNTAQSPVPHDNQWDHDSFTLPRDPYDGIREDHGAFERAALCLLCFVCLRTLRSYHLFLRALSTSTRMKAGIGPRSVQRVSLLIMSVMSSGV
ncbi:hypothetical protein B0H14DRAFT_3755552, partial [Mycena olivaceomarginata]